MKIKFIVEYDTETEMFSFKSKDVKLEHSGSSYHRIKLEGYNYQIGTIGGICLCSDQDYLGWDRCLKRHFTIGIDQESFKNISDLKLKDMRREKFE